MLRGAIDAANLIKSKNGHLSIFPGDVRRKKKTTIITIEASERTTIRRNAGRALSWCPRCRCAVLAVTLEEAAVIAGHHLNVITRRIEAGEIHLIEDQSRVALIDRKSVV